MTNSDIDRIQVYINNKPRSVVEHVGTGRHYNINSKSGKLQLLFSEHNNDNDIYNTDISCYLDNMESLSRMYHPYVVIAPSYMVYSIDFDQFYIPTLTPVQMLLSFITLLIMQKRLILPVMFWG